MLKSHKIAWVIVFAAAFTLIVTSAWAATASEPRIGVVDVQRVTTNAPRMKQFSEELKALERSLAAKLDLRAQYLMLSENEIEEFIDLKTNTKPTGADNNRIKALADVERTRDAKLKQLQGIKDLNTQEKTELKALQGIQQKSQESGKTMSKDYYNLYQSKSQELSTKADSEMKAVINKVTEAKGLSLVLSKQIALPDGTAADTVLFGGVDITDDVISRMDRLAQ